MTAGGGGECGECGVSLAMSAKLKKNITLKKEIQEEIIVEYKRRVVVDSDIELHHPIWWS